MKKAVHILMIVTLSLSMVMIGKGVNLVICEHAHTVKFFPSYTKKEKPVSHCSSHHCSSAKEDCSGNPDEDCMNKIFYSLSQSEVSPELNVDVTSNFIILPLQIEKSYDCEEPVNEKIGLHIIPKSPRDCLSLFSILLI